VTGAKGAETTQRTVCICRNVRVRLRVRVRVRVRVRCASAGRLGLQGVAAIRRASLRLGLSFLANYKQKWLVFA
jgi:hypothetical protein